MQRDRSPEEQARFDELRRRVYGPAASDADRREYAALAGQADPPEQEAEPSPPPPARRERNRRGTRIAVAVAAPVLVVAVVIVAALTAQTGTPSPFASQKEDPAGFAAAAPTSAPLPTPVLLYEDDGRIHAQQTSGGGSATVALALDGAPRDGGRLVVAVTSSDPSPIGWTAERPSSGSHDDAMEPIAASPAALRQGGAPEVVRYSGAPPTQIEVRSATGTGWTITVGFLQ